MTLSDQKLVQEIDRAIRRHRKGTQPLTGEMIESYLRDVCGRLDTPNSEDHALDGLYRVHDQLVELGHKTEHK